MATGKQDAIQIDKKVWLNIDVTPQALDLRCFYLVINFSGYKVKHFTCQSVIVLIKVFIFIYIFACVAKYGYTVFQDLLFIDRLWTGKSNIIVEMPLHN
ncbi:hypothetical protein KUTeg_001950 [Tegillarca granosa]|uniref:Uncharacterized protein n=1 Tax=Tegillarca granosa TaxID=220873 RepID=A0ABQ9FSX9_TEGGR|nr:hypothetical protein KUTeg_001950 [Tegillarca granosa]